MAISLVPFSRSQVTSSSASLRLAPSTASGNFVAETQRQAEIIKATLKALQARPSATTDNLISSIIGTSSCITSVDEAVASIDAAVGALVATEADITLLGEQVRAMQAQTKATGLLSGAADVIESLDSLLPKLYNSPGNSCGTSPEATVEELRQLARIISDTASLPGAQAGSKAIKETGRYLYAVSGFIRDVRRTYAELSNNCESGQASTLALATTIEDLADLFGVLGSYSEAEKIRKGALQVRLTVEKLAPLDGLSLWDRPSGLDCSSASLEGAASTMRELAIALEDKGLQQISEELGISLDFTSFTGVEF